MTVVPLKANLGTQKKPKKPVTKESRRSNLGAPPPTEERGANP